MLKGSPSALMASARTATARRSTSRNGGRRRRGDRASIWRYRAAATPPDRDASRRSCGTREGSGSDASAMLSPASSMASTSIVTCRAAVRPTTQADAHAVGPAVECDCAGRLRDPEPLRRDGVAGLALVPPAPSSIPGVRRRAWSIPGYFADYHAALVRCERAAGRSCFRPRRIRSP